MRLAPCLSAPLPPPRRIQSLLGMLMAAQWRVRQRERAGAAGGGGGQTYEVFSTQFLSLLAQPIDFHLLKLGYISR